MLLYYRGRREVLWLLKVRMFNSVHSTTEPMCSSVIEVGGKFCVRSWAAQGKNVL